jgi:hypothetical protein
MLFDKIFRGIKNLIAWVPVIWGDRDWDWAYLFEIISFKSRKMARSFRESGLSTSADDIANELEELADAIDRYIADDYLDETLRSISFEEHFGDISMGFEPIENGLYQYTGPEFSKVNSPGRQEAAERVYRIARYISEIKRQEDKERIISLLKGFEQWWD